MLALAYLQTCLTAIVYIKYIVACTSAAMTFTLETLYNAEKKITSCFDSVLSVANRKKIQELSEKVLNTNQIKKSDLASTIMNLVNVLESTHSVLKSASVKIEDLLSDQVEDKKTIIQLQEKSLESKDKEVAAVQSMVKSEIKTFAEIVKSENKSSVTTQNIKRAVKSAVSEEQRSENVVIFGLREEGQHDKLGERVMGIVKLILDDKTPTMIYDAVRIGTAKDGVCRPVKVKFESKEVAMSVFSNAKKLRQYPVHKSIYVSPDRSAEERAERKKLVCQLKEKIEKEPEMYHFIQNGKVNSTEKRERTPSPPLSTTPTDTQQRIKLAVQNLTPKTSKR